MARPSARAVSSGAADVRLAALDAYIERRAAQGFHVETRSGGQAVIVRRHRLYFVLRWVAHGLAEQRLVVSVDQYGEVGVLAAQPVRW
jgi:hypothetical protein